MILIIYSNGIYVFDLATDGCFIYVEAELNSDFYRKGTYELTGDMLELKFVHEGLNLPPKAFDSVLLFLNYKFFIIELFSCKYVPIRSAVTENIVAVFPFLEQVFFSIDLFYKVGRGCFFSFV